MSIDAISLQHSTVTAQHSTSHAHLFELSIQSGIISACISNAQAISGIKGFATAASAGGGKGGGEGKWDGTLVDHYFVTDVIVCIEGV